MTKGAYVRTEASREKSRQAAKRRVYARSDVAVRFWARVDNRGNENCWPFLGAHTTDGYGHFQVGSRRDGSRRMVYAHRLAWELTHGKIPQGQLACHKCDQPSCCNPSHLFLGSSADNVADMDAKGRRVATAMKGERHGRAKLTDDDVRNIRRIAGHESRRSTSIRFGVTEKTIGSIQRGDTWRHVV